MLANICAVSAKVNGRIIGPISGVQLHGTCPIDKYRSGFLSFVKNEKWSIHLAGLANAVVIIPEKLSFLGEKYPDNTYIVVEDVALALMDIQDLFYVNLPSNTFKGISPGAVISVKAEIGVQVNIADNVYILENCIIGDNVTIGPNTYIMDHVRIGEHTYIFGNVTIHPGTVIGRDCLIHFGAVIGTDGFRMEQDLRNKFVRKMTHAGFVYIGDNVEIGANDTIARATFENESTSIADYVKLDAQVHIGHNARIGTRSIIAAQSCIGGSAHIGEDVWVGTGANISNDVTIGDKAKILLNAVVAYDVPQGEMVSGFYAMPHRQWKTIWNRLIGKS
jgi:UDP-3-O-[3-hydroxymyristoyl] glucosamine N-acyltransferase